MEEQREQRVQKEVQNHKVGDENFSKAVSWYPSHKLYKGLRDCMEQGKVKRSRARV